MYRKYFLIVGCFIFLISCKKSSDAVPEDNSGDVVVGKYYGMVTPSGNNMTATVTKVNTGSYRFAAGGNLPSFHFNYDTSAVARVTTFFTNNIYYIIPAQNAGPDLLDSARMTFYSNGSLLDVQLTDKTNNNYWSYGGRKQ